MTYPHVQAILKDTPLQFHVSQDFAMHCVNAIGSVVHHAVLGSIFCEEAVIHEDGSLQTLVFVGTSNRNGLRK